MQIMETKHIPNGSNPNIDPNYYPGKPGPAPTGLKRKVSVLFMVSRDEFEFMNRAAIDEEKNVSEFMRSQIFTSTWEIKLKHLRADQGANIKRGGR